MTPKRWTIVGCITGTVALLKLAAILALVLVKHPGMSPGYTVAVGICVLLGVASLHCLSAARHERLERFLADEHVRTVGKVQGIRETLDRLASVLPQKGPRGV